MHVIRDTDDVKLKSIHAVHWLSFGEANVARHRTMRAVAEVFQQDAELMHDTMAETLAKAMLTYEFIAINIGQHVTSTITALRAMQIGDEGGPKFQEFLANIAENNSETYFKGEKIKATRQAVDGRDGNLSLTQTPAAQSGHLFKELVHANYSKNSFQELVKIMATQHAGFLPETTKLLAAISVIPMSTVPCGRGFSVQNRIKTKGRARIKAENLDVLMRICIEGPPIEQSDFYRALEKL
ncbi:hypothetical protein JOQ06_010056 [Pogonophryne albipinna]|uniref:HAT C-terminal dimerisation domain-containing protein n=1 Tax=Pogonophryne albipinna TaxID=1090488 RepID=A0AAD6AWM5_9TELE|nr:hypothetical protein JOQ06_010056 [Pogonophryne albipinna]